MKIIGGMDGSPSPCSRMFGTRLALQQGLGHSSAAGLLQLTQSLRLVALFITGNFQVREKCLRNESPLILYTYITIYIYIIVYIYTSGDENITQWPSGDLFPQPAPFSTASGALPGVRGPQQPFAASKPSRPMPGFPPKPPGSAPDILSDQPINHGLPMDTP